jgi:hypothetical protein
MHSHKRNSSSRAESWRPRELFVVPFHLSRKHEAVLLDLAPVLCIKWISEVGYTAPTQRVKHWYTQRATKGNTQTNKLIEEAICMCMCMSPLPQQLAVVLLQVRKSLLHRQATSPKLVLILMNVWLKQEPLLQSFHEQPQFESKCCHQNTP